MTSTTSTLRSVENAIQEQIEVLFRRDQLAERELRQREEAIQQDCNNMRRQLVNRLADTDQVKMAAGEWEVSLDNNRDGMTQDLLYSATYLIAKPAATGMVHVRLSLAQCQNRMYRPRWFGSTGREGSTAQSFDSFIAAATYAATGRS